jgi:hypothetical protein
MDIISETSKEKPMNNLRMLFDESEVGCYADGTFGHECIRWKLAELIEDIDPMLAKELRSTSSDCMSEENEAIDLLNDRTQQNCRWEMVDGDLMLSLKELGEI